MSRLRRQRDYDLRHAMPRFDAAADAAPPLLDASAADAIRRAATLMMHRGAQRDTDY